MQGPNQVHFSLLGATKPCARIDSLTISSASLLQHKQKAIATISNMHALRDYRYHETTPALHPLPRTIITCPRTHSPTSLPSLLNKNRKPPPYLGKYLPPPRNYQNIPKDTQPYPPSPKSRNKNTKPSLLSLACVHRPCHLTPPAPHPPTARSFMRASRYSTPSWESRNLDTT